MAKTLLKILLGILSFVPVALAVIEFAVLLPIINRVSAHARGDIGQALLRDEEYCRWINIISIIGVITLGIIILFIVMASLNKRMTKGIRFVWALGILFVAPVMVPSYYFLFIVRKPPAPPSPLLPARKAYRDY